MPRINHLAFLLISLATTLAMAADRSDRLIADFESDSYVQWQATGDAFGPAPAAGTLDRQQPVSGYKGERLVNTFRHGDSATGTFIFHQYQFSADLAMEGPP